MSASLLLAASAAAAATTVDDLIIVTALFTISKATGRPHPGTIVAGQCAGFALIVSVSLLAAAGLQTVPDRWVGLLGFIPIGFGAWHLWRLRGTSHHSRPGLALTAPRIAAVTFANGADNIGVFTPLLRSLHWSAALMASTGFMALVAVWCALGALLGTHRAVVTLLSRISHWLVPLVLIVVGVVILISTGALRLIAVAV